jgi:hypothetical protein
MAYTSCAASLAANIARDCEHPIVGGYTGTGVLLPLSSVTPNIVQDTENPRKIKTISIGSGEKAVFVDNVTTTPFTGSSTAGNADSGYPEFLKTIAVRVPQRGADVSKDIIEPLFEDPEGFIGIFPKRDKVGDGSFEVVGFLNPLRGDIASLTRDESANGGAWAVNLTCTEAWAEVTLVGAEDDYASALAAFEALKAQTF